MEVEMKTNIIPFSDSRNGHSLETGIVKAKPDESVIVEINGAVIHAGRAFSCLVSPVPGDRVLLSCSAQECFVLAVLERKEQKMTLDFPGDVCFRSVKGTIALEAGNRVEVSALKRIDGAAPEVSLVSGKSRMISDELTLRARKVETHADEANLFVKAITAVSDRVTQRAKTVARVVEGVETLRIGDLIQTVRRTLTLRSRYANITARKDMKLDGERIHMG